MKHAETMTSKKKMKIAMEHEDPDRVSYMSTFVPEVELLLQEKNKKELAEIGSNTELKYQGMNELDILVRTRYAPVDVRNIDGLLQGHRF